MPARVTAISTFSPLTLLLLTLAAPAAENDPAHWAQWRGPAMTGESTTANPPTKWSETENIKWKVKIPGKSTGSPVVHGDRIFLQTAINTGRRATAGAIDLIPTPTIFAQQDRRGGRGGGGGFGRGTPPTEIQQFALLCIDLNSGKTLWQKIAKEEVPHEGHHAQSGTFASFSPVTDGAHVYASFGSRGVYCYDMEGNLKWKKYLGQMRILLSFGEGSSPALADDTLVIKWDHEGDDFIVALDKNTGEERWRKPRQEASSWTTPLIVEHDGRKQVIAAASSKLHSYDLKTGEILWEHAGLTRNTIPTPVFGDGLLFTMSGYQGNQLWALRLGRTGDLTNTDAVVWSHKRGTPYVPSPLLYAGRLYFFANFNNRLSIFEAKSGKPFVESQPVEEIGDVYASPVAASGRIYLVDRNGTTAVLKPSDKVEVIAVNKLDDKFDASPALVGNQIILRGLENLYCIAEK